MLIMSFSIHYYVNIKYLINPLINKKINTIYKEYK